MSAVIESESRFPGLPTPAYVPAIFTKLDRISGTAAFFVGGYRRTRDLRMTSARNEPAGSYARRTLVRDARKDNRELVRWLRASR
jgi:hypothetical protein